MKPAFIDRDVSWLSFNARVLEEAAQQDTPLAERLKFLSIFSSNLDEFYRVRMPALLALQQLKKEPDRQQTKVLDEVNRTIVTLQERYGVILREVIAILHQHNVHFVFNEAIPEAIDAAVCNYFLDTLAGYIEVIKVEDAQSFFPENNRLYLWTDVKHRTGSSSSYIVLIPSHALPRFFFTSTGQQHYIVFIDDIIRHQLHLLFQGATVKAAHSFKVTRDAELNLSDEYEGNVAAKIAREIAKRDKGLATRLLFPAHMEETSVSALAKALSIRTAHFVRGSIYHNLKDLGALPLPPALKAVEAWPQVQRLLPGKPLFEHLTEEDILLHTPYHRYEPVIRLFNEAAIDPLVERISVTLYRVAEESRLVQALITAARNGKKVLVFVELKAHFDEANNLKWAARLRSAGVRVIYSIPGLKVHAKVALIHRKLDGRLQRFGVFATGNFNESTARFYTDHVLLTANAALLEESEKLFSFLRQPTRVRRKKPEFNHLLVAQFNLQHRLLQLIDDETALAKQGMPASISIKMNNLEEKVLINKLCEAARAGVAVTLIVRGICCVLPIATNHTGSLRILRIVDRYLEHGRIFVFHRNGNPLVLLGSADWMNRNIYRRIEVCFPVYDENLKQELLTLLNIQ